MKKSAIISADFYFISAALYDKAELYWRKWILNRGI